jgi:Uma2 family endonuclease
MEMDWNGAMVSLTLPLVLETKEVHLTDEQFYQLCLSNPDLTIERSALIVMTPVGGDGGSCEMDLGGELNLWNKQPVQGKVFSSSTLFNIAQWRRSLSRCRMGGAIPLAISDSGTETQIPSSCP